MCVSRKKERTSVPRLGNSYFKSEKVEKKKKRGRGAQKERKPKGGRTDATINNKGEEKGRLRGRPTEIQLKNFHFFGRAKVALKGSGR